MIRATDDKIIVTELKRTKTKSGLIIPENAIEPQAYGKVISVGPTVSDKDINVGDVIVYHKMGGQAISMNNKILCCVPYPEIYGILEDETLLSELNEIETIKNEPASSLIKAV